MPGTDPKGAIDFLSAHRRLLVSTHVNPDGDGIGAVMGLAWLIERLGGEAVVLIDSAPPDTFTYLTGYGRIARVGDDPLAYGSFDALVVADAPFRERLGKVTTLVPDELPTLIIDHHPVEECHGTCRFIDEAASSSCELVLRLVRASGFPLDKEVASALYTGLLVDTGRFRFSNTSPSALRAAADMVEAGVEPHVVAERLFYTNTLETTRALGRFIASLELFHGGTIAIASFDHAFVTSEEYARVDTEGFVNHALAIVGVEVAAFMREVKPGVTRASLRAKHDVDVNLVARSIGGGGHAKAAGCTIGQPLSDAKQTLVGTLARAIEKNRSPLF